jgi:MFS transporter, DHA2 family, multidrug resistance protein
MVSKLRPAVVLWVTSISMVVITVNMTFVSIGLPDIARQLHSSNTGLEWIMDGYSLTFACLLLVAGYLGDRFGAREVLVAGLAVFTLASLAGAMATSTSQLIAARCLMGVGAAGVMPMTLSMISHVYVDPDKMRRAIGAWAGIGSAAAVVAPLVAGLLLAKFWWGSLFWCNVPLGALALVAVLLATPRFEGHRTGTFDWLGSLLSILFAGLLVAALIEGPQRGWGDQWVLIGFALSVVSLVAFVLWERRQPEPLIEVRLFGIPRFAIGVCAVATQYLVGFGQGFGVTQYVQLVLGNSALRAGLLGIPAAIAITIFSPVGARFFSWVGPRRAITSAMAVMTVSSVAMALFTVEGGYPRYFASSILMSVGIGLMAAGTTTMVMSSVKPEHAGMASGAQSTTRQLGGALGIAMVGSIVATTYGAHLARSLDGTAAAGYFQQAKGSLAAALEIRNAPAQIYGIISHASKAAFVDALRLSGWALALISVVVGVAAWVILSPRLEGAAIEVPAPDLPALQHHRADDLLSAEGAALVLDPAERSKEGEG